MQRSSFARLPYPSTAAFWTSEGAGWTGPASTKVAKKVADNAHEESDTTMKKSKSGAKEAKGGDSPSHLIDARIAALADWRGETLARVRALIKQADPDVVEEVKWRKPSNAMLGVPVWEHAGIICTGETYKAAVKLTFAGPLSGRVETGRPPGKRPDSKI